MDHLLPDWEQIAIEIERMGLNPCDQPTAPISMPRTIKAEDTVSASHPATPLSMSATLTSALLPVTPIAFTDTPTAENTVFASHSPTLLSTAGAVPVEDPVPVSKPATTFHGFSKLPAELRIKIWNENMPGPRIVEIEWCESTQSWFCPPESAVQPCKTLLQVCRESRSLYLDDWVPLAPYLKARPESVERMLARLEAAKDGQFVLFNPKIDTVYMDRSIWKDFEKAKEGLISMPNVRCLSVGQNTAPLMDSSHLEDVIRLIRGLDDLKTLMTVGGDAAFAAGSTSKGACQGIIEFYAWNDLEGSAEASGPSNEDRAMVEKECTEQGIKLEHMVILRDGKDPRLALLIWNFMQAMESLESFQWDQLLVQG